MSITSGIGLISGINFELHGGGTITGRVTDATGSGIAEGWVKAYGMISGFAALGKTDSEGDYEISGLVSDGYRVYFHGEAPGYCSKWYNDEYFCDGATAVMRGQNLFTVEKRAGRGCRRACALDVPSMLIFQNRA